MITVFLLMVYLGTGDDRSLISNDMYFASITDCNWYASQVTKRYGNYRYQDHLDAKDRVTAYCIPKTVDQEKTRIYWPK